MLNGVGLRALRKMCYEKIEVTNSKITIARI
jgi:hypothetical protein